MSKKKSSRDGETGSLQMKRIFFCSAVSVVLFYMFLIVFSYSELKISFGAESYMPFGIASALISSIAGGFICVYKTKKNIIVSGALTGLITAFISNILIFIINRAAGTGMLLVFIASVIGSISGAMIAANIKIRRKY